MSHNTNMFKNYIDTLLYKFILENFQGKPLISHIRFINKKVGKQHH